MRNCIEITKDSISVEGILAKLEIWVGNEEMVANDDAIHLVQVLLGNCGICPSALGACSDFAESQIWTEENIVRFAGIGLEVLMDFGTGHLWRFLYLQMCEMVCYMMMHLQQATVSLEQHHCN